MESIGQRIAQVLHEQERTVVWLSRKLYCNRQNIYDIFHRDSIDTNLLLRISKILNHDFFVDFSRELHETKDEKTESGKK